MSDDKSVRVHLRTGEIIDLKADGDKLTVTITGKAENGDPTLDELARAMKWVQKGVQMTARTLSGDPKAKIDLLMTSARMTPLPPDLAEERARDAQEAT